MLNLLSSPHRSFGALRPLTAHLVLATVLVAVPALAQKKPEVLMEGASAKVQTTDVQAELQRMPTEVRERVLAQPDMLRQLILQELRELTRGQS